MNEINYGLAQPKEAKQISILYHTIYIDTYGLNGVTEELSNFSFEQFSAQNIVEDIKRDDRVLWLARKEDNPVGILKVELEKPCPLQNIVAPEINKLYLLRRFFGKNIAQRLLLQAEEELRKKGEKQVWLWALSTNMRAINFYRKNNYREIGKAYFQMEVNRYENTVMLKDL